MPLEHTGIISGAAKSALIVNPESAYVITAQCLRGCGACFWVIGALWSDDPDQATIFRSFDGAEIAKEVALSQVFGCLAQEGVSFDVKTLAGFVK